MLSLTDDATAGEIYSNQSRQTQSILALDHEQPQKIIEKET